MTDRKTHAHELQRPMALHHRRPACHTMQWPPPAKAPGFWDNGQSCGNAMSPALWAIALEHTPGCLKCTRALRGLLLHGGPPWWTRSAVKRAGFHWPLDFDLSEFDKQEEDATP